MKTYKIGNLPFVFNSRKQIGDFTIFKNVDSSVEFKIKTETLNKNTSIFENDFSELMNRLNAITHNFTSDNDLERAKTTKADAENEVKLAKIEIEKRKKSLAQLEHIYKKTNKLTDKQIEQIKKDKQMIKDCLDDIKKYGSIVDKNSEYIRSEINWVNNRDWLRKF